MGTGCQASFFVNLNNGRRIMPKEEKSFKLVNEDLYVIWGRDDIKATPEEAKEFFAQSMPPNSSKIIPQQCDVPV